MAPPSPPMPAPKLPPVFPFAIVRPEIPTVELLLVMKMRKLGVPAAGFRCTVNCAAPGPLKFTLPAIWGRAVDSVIGLVTPLKLIAIVPQLETAFASWIAARKVQAPPAVRHSASPLMASPSSPLLLTVKVRQSGG